jgi:glycosyltransferase involved in cell wall biosynthesis
VPQPTVVTVHDLTARLARRRQRANLHYRSVYRWCDELALRGLKRADALIAVSEWTKRALVQELGIPSERIHVVHHGVDLVHFQRRMVADSFRQRYGLAAAARYILYVGSEAPWKNLDALLRAFARVLREHPDVRLVKVGSPRHPTARARLQGLAASLGVSQHVHWIDDVPDSDLPLFYNLADLMVLPSLYEGFGMPVLEALACGTRVVCSNTTSLPEVAGADSILCPPTVERLSQAISRALAGPSDPRQVAERRCWAESFTWSSCAAKVRAVYDSLCRPRSAVAS